MGILDLVQRKDEGPWLVSRWALGFWNQVGYMCISRWTSGGEVHALV